MKLAVLKNALTSKVGRQILTVRKHSPALLFGAGIVGIIGTVVLASRATLKLEEVLDEAEADLDRARNLQSVSYSEDDRRKDVVIVYTRAIAKITRLYAPAVGLGILSVAALTGSHVILNRRNAAITAAYAALDRGFRQYRARVVGELGEDKDREFRYGAADREIIEETENGPVTKMVKRVGPDGASIYAKYFDEGSENWVAQPGYNWMFLRSTQNWANNLLQANGYVFLNEVYQMLGLKRTSEGAVVGWIKGSNGDDYIDFGVFDGNSQNVRDFVNGWNKAILLDFNVDGIIYDKI